MHEHERDYESDERSRSGQTKWEEPSGHDLRAAASGRLDALGAEAAFGVQRSAGNAAMQASVQRSKVYDVIERAAGDPVPADIRHTVEASYGPMPGDARWHSDPEALESAREVGAYAYASGRDIVAPADAPRSVQLEEAFHLAQQLKHDDVAQTDLGNGVLVSENSDRYEREAQELAARHASGTSAEVEPAVAVGASPVVGAATAATGHPVQRAVLDEQPGEEPEEDEAGLAPVQRSVADGDEVDEEEYAEE